MIKPFLMKTQIREQNKIKKNSNTNLSNNYQTLYRKNTPKLMKTTINNVKLLIRLKDKITKIVIF